MSLLQFRIHQWLLTIIGSAGLFSVYRINETVGLIILWVGAVFFINFLGYLLLRKVCGMPLLPKRTTISEDEEQALKHKTEPQAMAEFVAWAYLTQRNKNRWVGKLSNPDETTIWYYEITLNTYDRLPDAPDDGRSSE